MIHVKECNKEQFEEIIRFAETMGISAEEYLLGLHEKNKSMKDMLLRDGSGFKQFVEDFHSLLDNMTIFKEGVLSNVSDEKDKALLKVVQELLFKASSDPMLLAQIYEHYNYEENEYNSDTLET